MSRFLSLCGLPSLVALMALLVSPAGAAPAALAVPAGELASLVKQLGDEEFVVRETAAEKLTKIGLAAREALEEGSKDSDREIRYRCERILAQVRQLDFAQRIEAFSHDRDSDNDHGLPGWKRFRKVAGDDVSARSLFVEMLKAELETLAAVEKDPRSVGESLLVRMQQMQQLQLYQANQLPLGSIATFLFVAIDEDVALPTQASQMLSSMFQQQSFASVMQGGQRRELLAKMFGTWLKRTDDYNLYQGLYLAMNYNIPDGLALAERVFKKQGNNNILAQPYVRQQAILCVARFGSEKQIPLLEPLLEDKVVVFPKQQNFFNETQMRDVALAALVHLSKQDLKAFGFEKAQTNPTTVVAMHTLGFETEEKRDAALKKWMEYRAGKG
jgi:HEAT repeat protein